MISKTEQEAKKVLERYARRDAELDASKYDRLSVGIQVSSFEREQIWTAMLKQVGGWATTRSKTFDSAKILEIGCGSGGNLIWSIKIGANPVNITGVDLISSRIAHAAQRLPIECTLICTDAASLPDSLGSFDVVIISTVFSSILDDDVRIKVATEAWNRVSTGGMVLGYDLRYNNPRNPDVRRVTRKEWQRLFPSASKALYRRATLLPPLARFVCQISPILCFLIANFFPFLRTHLVVALRK